MTRPRLDKNELYVQIKVPKDVHRDAKIAARIDRRTMTQYMVQAIEERNRRFLEEHVESDKFVPPGLRR